MVPGRTRQPGTAEILRPRKAEARTQLVRQREVVASVPEINVPDIKPFAFGSAELTEGRASSKFDGLRC